LTVKTLMYLAKAEEAQANKHLLPKSVHISERDSCFWVQFYSKNYGRRMKRIICRFSFSQCCVLWWIRHFHAVDSYLEVSENDNSRVFIVSLLHFVLGIHTVPWHLEQNKVKTKSRGNSLLHPDYIKAGRHLFSCQIGFSKIKWEAYWKLMTRLHSRLSSALFCL